MDVWDASFDLTRAAAPGASWPDELPVDRVRAAVERLKGAGVASVEDCRGAPPGLRWVTVYEPGDARPRSGGPWTRSHPGSRRR